MPIPLAGSPVHVGKRDCEAAGLGAFEAPAVVRQWHLASLDAPTVAVAWSLSFAWVARIQLPFWVPALIALGTWCVYVADRLIDTYRAFRAGNWEPLRERHFFHWHHRRLLVPLAATAGIVVAVIVLAQVPNAVRERDSVLAAATLAYFWGVHLPRRRPQWVRQFWSKELAVGVLFTAGCALPTLARMPTGSAASLAFLGCAVLFFATLAWLNCSAINGWESGQQGRIFAMARALGIVALLLAVGIFPYQPRVSALLAAGSVSALLLGLLDRWRDRMSPLALRCAADLVLLTPVVWLAR